MITIHGTTTHPADREVTFTDTIATPASGDVTAAVLAHMASRPDAWLWLGVEVIVTFTLVIP